MAKLLIISSDIVDKNMAGPGIRALEMARALSSYAAVTLAIPNECSLRSEAMRIRTYDRAGVRLRDLVGEADAILVQGFTLHNFPFLVASARPLIVDLYDPFIIENLEVHSFRTMVERHQVHSRDLGVQVEQLRAGDFFLCANERQRDYWLGMLSAAGRINPHNYRADKSLRKLIDVVPFGLADQAAVHTENVLKGAHPGIGIDDQVILWGGGIWAWLDPFTPIRAMSRVAAANPRARLFFMGKAHPNPEIASVMGLGPYAQAVKLSQDLGLFGRSVFFNDQWVEYDRRHNYLLEADLGISFHQDFAEMRYASRTRLLDYIWCGLPILCSKGDPLSEVVEGKGFGRTVRCGDDRGVAEALIELLSLPDLKIRLKPSFERVSATLTWASAVRPLIDFLAQPQRAPDHQA